MGAVKKPERAPSRTYTYWLTRDSDPETGAVGDKMRVWLAKPDRMELGLGHVWIGDHDSFYAEWTAEMCLRFARTYPDDDRQCVRVDGDSVRPPGGALA